MTIAEFNAQFHPDQTVEAIIDGEERIGITDRTAWMHNGRDAVVIIDGRSFRETVKIEDVREIWPKKKLKES